MGNPHTAPLGDLIALVDDLETRLSAARATKLDNLDKAISALNDLAVSDLTGNTLCFYSQPKVLTVINSGVTHAIESVSIPSLTMPTIKHAYAGLIFVFVDTSGSTNNLSGTQYIQVDKAAAGWLSGIKFYDGAYRMGANLSFGSIAMGHVDIKDKVAFGSTTTFQWLDSAALGNGIFTNLISVVQIII